MNANHIDIIALREAIAESEATIGLNGDISDFEITLRGFGRPSLLSNSLKDAGVVELKNRFTGNSETRLLWAKQLRRPREEVSCVFEAYARLLAAQLEVAAPRPLAVDWKNMLMLFEYSPGRSLLYLCIKDAILRTPTARSRAIKSLVQIGEYLARYQNVSQEQSIPAGDFLATIDRDIVGCSGLNSHERILLRERLDTRWGSELWKTDVEMTRPHNDFTLRNIIVGDDNTTRIIDWDASADERFSPIGSKWWDPFFMWLNILSVSRFRPIVEPTVIWGLADQFLSAYLVARFGRAAPSNQLVISDIFFVLLTKFFVGSGSRSSLAAHYKIRRGHVFVQSAKAALKADCMSVLLGCIFVATHR